MKRASETDLVRLVREGKKQEVFDFLIANNVPLSEEILKETDPLFEERSAEKKVVPVEALEKESVATGSLGKTRVYVWQGDITCLKIEAIVNACNDKGLGCFKVGHKCIDNVIHSFAGPRLREECRNQLLERKSDLSVGKPPLITAGFKLPAKYIIHVTGPELPPTRNGPTQRECQELSDTYKHVLLACVKQGIRQVAFNCLSTGAFRFPNALACQIALSTVRECLGQFPDALDAVVFDVFLEKDRVLYDSLFGAHFAKDSTLSVAKSWLNKASRVLVVAGAGMSAYPPGGPNVYVDKKAFAAAYPDMPDKGFHTAYECMGLFGSDLPMEDKYGFMLRHMKNMCFSFPPAPSYALLQQLLSGKDVFILTSNVDNCFVRAGFDANKMYMPQGLYSRYQCRKPCRPDSVWSGEQLISDLVPLIGADGRLPTSHLPRCRHCQGPVCGNVRGGNWFAASPYREGSERLTQWLGEKQDELVVLEIGCGMNTPFVTRFFAEAVSRQLHVGLIRLNPDHSEVPND